MYSPSSRVLSQYNSPVANIGSMSPVSVTDKLPQSACNCPGYLVAGRYYLRSCKREEHRISGLDLSSSSQLALKARASRRAKALQNEKAQSVSLLCWFLFIVYQLCYYSFFGAIGFITSAYVILFSSLTWTGTFVKYVISKYQAVVSFCSGQPLKKDVSVTAYMTTPSQESNSPSDSLTHH
ncbi:hypothetical protein DSO57_1007620 [Entomophthora muscae]|uniref:Uncharacterized protein n=1 Tax=Entomophthora muscae TaxID=34485 RepID=A0ACC2TUB0_9FUNG|nr:hypothetical protein DSO57_1007620 [Entomophthora muscae]